MYSVTPHSISRRGFASSLLIYVKERFPAPVAFIYSLLFASSITTFFYHESRLARVDLIKTTLLIGATIFLFFLRLRLFDEIKDFAYDSLYHPERPVQQGVVPISVIKRLAILVLLVEICLQALVPAAAVLAYLIVLGYSLLMFKEFFMDQFLSRHLALKLFLHQMIFVTLTVYAASVAQAHFFVPPFGRRLLLFPTLLVPTLLFELGRKLEHRRDAQGARTDDTYAYRWGTTRTFIIIMVAVLAHIICLLLLSPRQSILVTPYLAAMLVVIALFIRNKALVIKTAKVWSVALALVGQALFLILNLL